MLDLDLSYLPMLYTVDIVLTKTSRAANEATMPMPIFQSKPSGAMAGSMARPGRPAKLLRNCSPARSFCVKPLNRRTVEAAPGVSDLTVERFNDSTFVRGDAANPQSRRFRPRISAP